MRENVKERLFDSRRRGTQGLTLGYLETSAACVSSNDSHDSSVIALWGRFAADSFPFFGREPPRNEVFRHPRAHKLELLSINSPGRNISFVSKIWKNCQRAT